MTSHEARKSEWGMNFESRFLMLFCLISCYLISFHFVSIRAVLILFDDLRDNYSDYYDYSTLSVYSFPINRDQTHETSCNLWFDLLSSRVKLCIIITHPHHHPSSHEKFKNFAHHVWSLFSYFIWCVFEVRDFWWRFPWFTLINGSGT